MSRETDRTEALRRELVAAIVRRTLYRLFPGGLPQRDDGLREAANA
jgi:hypothetical protein